MREWVPKEHHFRAQAAIEYLLKVVPVTQENLERFKSMAVFEVWFSYFEEYLIDVNTKEECERWVDLFRWIDYNVLLWNQERRDTKMENCFNEVWTRWQTHAMNEDQWHILAKNMETMTEEIMKEIDDPEEVFCLGEEKLIERRSVPCTMLSRQNANMDI